MLRVKLSKLKHVCATVLLPRIYKETKFLKDKIDKYSVVYLGKIRKSTDSGSKDEEYEKQMRIIEKCFPEKATVIDVKPNDNTNELPKESFIEGNVDNRGNKLTSKGFEYDKIEDSSNTKPFSHDDFVQATTAKIEEEKLTQKIDQIDETPHVEAGVGKIEGFNITPRVLGHDKNVLDGSSFKHTISVEQREEVNLDELAKRCLSSPVGDIDQIFLNELENISRKHSQKVKVNFPTDDSNQKYFSQAFENTIPKNELVSDISGSQLEQVPNKEEKGGENKEMADRFHPFQLNTVPVFPIDVNGMRYKENEFTQGYSPMGNNLLLDIPAVLEPYDMQAIPFYEYVSKKNIILQEIPGIEVAARTETIQETNINTPMNEDVILQRNVDSEFLTDNETKELEETESAALNPMIAETTEPSIETQKLSDSDVTKLLEYKNVISTSLDVTGKNNFCSDKISPSHTDNACVLTSTTDEPPNLDGTFQNESSNSAISNAYPATNTRRSLELPVNTAISANQKPEEYFELPKDNFQSFVGSSNNQPEPIINDSRASNLTFTDILYSNIDSDTTVIDGTVTDTTVSAPKVFDTRRDTNNITSGDPPTQSVAFSAMPEFSEVDEDYREEANSYPNVINLDGPITHLLFQPELKNQETFKAESSRTSNNAAICSEDTIPLSILLKRVRQRNRLEFNRAVYLKSGPQPKQAKKVTCVPPLDRSKPKTNLSPNPCQPKPKPPCKPECPQPCPPKKDPCAKFIPLFLDAILKSDSSFDRSYSKQLYSHMYMYIASLSLTKDMTINKFKEMNQFLDFLSIKRNLEDNLDDVVCARDFDPWVPIPSWPIPEVEKKRPLVCPKDGCRLPVRPTPSNTDKPCAGMSKKISPTEVLLTPFMFDENYGSF